MAAKRRKRNEKGRGLGSHEVTKSRRGFIPEPGDTVHQGKSGLIQPNPTKLSRRNGRKEAQKERKRVSEVGGRRSVVGCRQGKRKEEVGAQSEVRDQGSGKS